MTYLCYFNLLRGGGEGGRVLGELRRAFHQGKRYGNQKGLQVDTSG